MARYHSSQEIATPEPSRRQFLGGALSAMAAAPLLGAASLAVAQEAKPAPHGLIVDHTANQKYLKGIFPRRPQVLRETPTC